MFVKKIWQSPQVGANLHRMILAGDVDVESAKAELFPNGVFKGVKIAQASIYIDTTTLKGSLYTESTNSWATKEQDQLNNKKQEK